jgi:uncharacterized membrane protein HdeD (DUF308 family)
MSGTTTTTTSPAPPTGRFPLARMMARGWWVFVLRGVVSILFGLLAFLAPGAGLAVILGFLAAWMAVDGVATLYQAVKGPPERHGVWFRVDGIVSLAAAAAILFLPGLSAFALVLVAGAWSAAVGVSRLIMAFRVGNVLLGLLGAVAVVAGVWLILAPGPGLLALIWLVGLEALIVGGLLIGLGWRLRRIHHDPHGPAAAATAPGPV